MSSISHLMGEGLIGISEAAKVFGAVRGEKATHVSTIRRWAKDGVTVIGRKERLRLESVVLSGRLMTTRQACLRFIEAQQPTPKAPTITRTPKERERAALQAAERLAGMGV